MAKFKKAPQRTKKGGKVKSQKLDDGGFTFQDAQNAYTGTAPSKPIPGSVYGAIGNIGAQAIQNYIPTGRANDPTYGVIGKSIAEDAVKDAGTGAAIGSAIPGIGTVVGAGIGAGVGAIQGWAGGVKQKKQAQASQAQASQAMGQSKVDSAYKKGGLATALKSGGLTPLKAKEILRDGTVHGKPITDRQKRYFGLIAGGGHAQKLAGGGGAGGGGGGGMSGGAGGGGIPAMGPVEHAKKPKGLLYNKGGLAKKLADGGDIYTKTASGDFVRQEKSRTMVYDDGKGNYFKSTPNPGKGGSPVNISKISKEEHDNWGSGNKGEYKDFISKFPDSSFWEHGNPKLKGQTVPGQSNKDESQTKAIIPAPSTSKDIAAPQPAMRDKAENIVPAKAAATKQSSMGAPDAANTDVQKSAPTVTSKDSFDPNPDVLNPSKVK
jgi:hypothetical protein